MTQTVVQKEGRKRWTPGLNVLLNVKKIFDNGPFLTIRVMKAGHPERSCDPVLLKVGAFALVWRNLFTERAFLNGHVESVFTELFDHFQKIIMASARLAEVPDNISCRAL